MPAELSNILQGIVKKATTVPAGENPELARMRKRFTDCTNATVVLCDISGSMMDIIGHSGIRKIDHLTIALADLMKVHPSVELISFGFDARRVKNVKELMYEFDHSGGSTNLTAGIEMASKLRPRRTVIISDGMPDNQDTATKAIDDLTGRVDCVYCGPDGHPAVGFLQSLARRGGGDQMTFDGCAALSPMIRGLLA